jgi:hypothetical protein
MNQEEQVFICYPPLRGRGLIGRMADRSGFQPQPEATGFNASGLLIFG